jgi:hypothetical protein
MLFAHWIAVRAGQLQRRCDGWPRACIPSAGIFRDGFVVFRFPDYSGTFSYYSYMLCEDGERTVIDGGDCVPLPVTASTWGAVKALYR